MSYYMGDFYGGRGDPGIGSFLGGIARTVVGAIPGVGPTLSRLLPQSGARATTSLMRLPAAGGVTGIAKSAVGKLGAAVNKHPVLSAAGAAGAMGAALGAGGERLLAGGACPKGHHISKKHGHCVKNRHMNFCNPRALRRATRRLHSFARHYRKVVGFVSPKKPKGRMYFKRRRKAA